MSRGVRWTTVFTKLPRAGEVKTRLVPPLGAVEAAELAEAMLADTLARCAASADFRTRLCVHPPEALGWFRARFPEQVELEAQSGAGLGQRLAAHVREHFARAAGSLVIVGSDAPHVGVERIVEAHERLEQGADVVFGPDEGGGYYLVGLARALPELFTSVTMSSASMLEETLALARARGLACALLARDFDVDLPADLERLARSGRAPARTAAVLARWTSRLTARASGVRAPA